MSGDFSIKNLIAALQFATFVVAIPALLFYLAPTYFPHWENFGVKSLRVEGLKGILFSPFIHGSFEHLFDNCAALLVLLTLFFYFFQKNTLLIFSFLYLFSGIGLWFIGRPGPHIGASGIVYALTLFLATSGFISGSKRLWGLALLIIFLYGSLIWGIFPLPEPNQISWEGHAAGSVTGLVAAFLFKNKIPNLPKEKKIIIEEPDDDEYPYWMEGYDENDKP